MREDNSRELSRNEILAKKRMLLIVDPQIDFITGSMPVPGAVEAMNALARYVAENYNLYSSIIVTCDRHPFNHKSFRKFGGEWPAHCVECSVGAAVWPALMESLELHCRYVSFVYKGMESDREEYSVFRSEQGSRRIHAVMELREIKKVDICGLAGDVCVKTTLEDAMYLYPQVRVNILKEFTASLDGGVCVRDLAEWLGN